VYVRRGWFISVIRDVITLGKPKIILLLAITCLCGSLVAAKGNPDVLLWKQVLAGLAGLVVSAAGGNTVNMWWDRDIDAVMKRTKRRPLPTGRRTPAFVLALGMVEIVLGFAVAWAGANLLTGLMALSGALFYVLIYTMLLKRRTVQNIVIGGAAGAFPPLVGWAAVQGQLHDPLPWLMFAIIFLWTPPHFWALALLSNADYTRAKVPMYPVVHGEALTRVAILRYLLVLLPVTLLPALFTPLGWLYLIMATTLGAWWTISAWYLFRQPEETRVQPLGARIVFRRSLYYLALVFAAMVVDAWL
jgi:protoheme IX farnesyltransferase